jgi:hypothetical protein
MLTAEFAERDGGWTAVEIELFHRVGRVCAWRDGRA